MILSNEGIQEALRQHQLSITPVPNQDQYTTSAVDLFLGDIEFCRVWDRGRFDLPGVKVELDLALQDFIKTAQGYLGSSGFLVA
jgi:deoxycytidine triphosphate deaminase